MVHCEPELVVDEDEQDKRQVVERVGGLVLPRLPADDDRDDDGCYLLDRIYLHP